MAVATSLDADGRVAPPAEPGPLRQGEYEWVFACGAEPFAAIPVRFLVRSAEGSYHLELSLARDGYAVARAAGPPSAEGQADV